MTHIPTSVRELATRLNDLDGLMTAAQWQRAALVFAFTQDGRGKNASSSVFGILNCKAFAALGISGLKSHTTVERYRAAWQSAIDAGKAVPVAPGDPYCEPAMEWPAAPAAPEMQPAKKTPREKEQEVLRLLDDPDVMDAMFADPMKRGLFAGSLGSYYGAQMETKPATPRTPPEPFSAVLKKASAPSLGALLRKARSAVDGIFELVSDPQNIPADAAEALCDVIGLHTTLDVIECRIKGVSVDTLTEKARVRA